MRQMATLTIQSCWRKYLVTKNFNALEQIVKNRAQIKIKNT